MTAEWRPLRNGQIDRMEYRDRLRYFADLSDEQMLAQAHVRAAVNQRSVRDVIVAWVLNGYISVEQKHRLLNAIEVR